MPYICVDLNLDEQLIQLSTAVHLALYLFSDNLARTKFMPTQSYIDIMIMVKNVYFCVAKTKVDNPSGKLFIIQLGTDRDIALSSAPEVTSSYVTTWVRVGVNRAQALYDTVVSSVFHTLLFVSIEFWTMYSSSFS